MDKYYIYNNPTLWKDFLLSKRTCIETPELVNEFNMKMKALEEERIEAERVKIETERLKVEAAQLKEKKENRNNTIIAVIILIVIILIIWGILAWIADGCDVSVGSVIFGILFFPAIFAAAAKG